MVVFWYMFKKYCTGTVMFTDQEGEERKELRKFRLDNGGVYLSCNEYANKDSEFIPNWRLKRIFIH